MEDLWAFNDEEVARSIFASQIPVIAAVGHEPDIPTADSVADLRAATPSNAAELAVPDQNEQYERLAQLERRMARGLEHRLEGARDALDRCRESRVFREPGSFTAGRRVLLDYQCAKLGNGLSAALGRERARFARLAAGLDAMSPLKVLGRGYAIPSGADGTVIRSVRDVGPGDRVTVLVRDGEIPCVVKGNESNG